MDNFTTNNYEMKRDIINFSKKISEGTNKPDSKDEKYCNLAMDSLGKNPVFLIDDSDIIKPLEEKFEDLGIVRDGSSRNKGIDKIVNLLDKRNQKEELVKYK